MVTLKKDHELHGVLTADGAVEAHSYWMYEAIMKELVLFYDPQPKKRGGEQQPEIVHYVTSLQDRYLLKLDKALSTHLLDNNVYAQIYGMRWTRLMFGREYPMTHLHSFRIWDYLFANSFTPAIKLSTHTKPKTEIDMGTLMVRYW